MLPSPFLRTLPSLHLCPFFQSVTWSPLQITRVCLRSVFCHLAHLFPTSALLDSHALIHQRSCIVTKQLPLSPERLPFPRIYTESRLTVCFLSRHHGLMNLPPMFFLSILLVWQGRVFQKHRWGQCRQTDFRVFEKQRKIQSTWKLPRHLGRGEIPNVKKLLSKT